MTNLDEILELPTTSEFTAMVCRVLDIHTDKKHSLSYPKKFSEVQKRYNEFSSLPYDLKIAEVLIGEKYLITKNDSDCFSKGQIESKLIFENEKYSNLKKKFAACFECYLSILSNLRNRPISINQFQKQELLRNYADYLLVPQIAILLDAYSSLDVSDFGLKERLPEYSPLHYIVDLISDISDEKNNVSGNTTNIYKRYLKKQLKLLTNDFPGIQYPSWDQFINNLNQKSTLKINKIDSEIKIIIKEYFTAHKFENTHQALIPSIYSLFYAVGIMLKFEQYLKTMGISVSYFYSKINEILQQPDKSKLIDNSTLPLNRELLNNMLMASKSPRENYDVAYNYYINSSFSDSKELDLLSRLLNYSDDLNHSECISNEIKDFLKNGISGLTSYLELEDLKKLYYQQQNTQYGLDQLLPELFEAYTLLFKSQKEDALLKLKSIENQPQLQQFNQIKKDILFLLLALQLSNKLPRNNHYEEELLKYIQTVPEYTDIRPIEYIKSNTFTLTFDTVALISADLSRELQGNEYLNYHTDKYELNKIISHYNALCCKFNLENNMYINPLLPIEHHLKSIFVHLASLFGVKFNPKQGTEEFIAQFKNTVIDELENHNHLNINFDKEFEMPESSLFFMPMCFWIDNPLLLLNIYFPDIDSMDYVNESFIVSELPFITCCIDILYSENNAGLLSYLDNLYHGYLDEFLQTSGGIMYARYFDLCNEKNIGF